MRRWLAVALLSACTTIPPGPFERAEKARLQGDLPAALLGYDQVPMQHPRYPEARAAAAGVERRLRRSHELLMQGILMRSEWRETEALAAFEQAREHWPGLPGVHELIAATHSRMELFRPKTGEGTVVSPQRVMTQPAVVAPESVAAADPQAKPVDTEISPSALPAPSVESAPLRKSSGDASLFARMRAIEERLQRGQLEAALADLAILQNQWPSDPNVCSRLGHLLHQRALLRYGQGSLPAALGDWRRVRELCPDWGEVRELMLKVEAEAARTH